jgi:signal transduction histidine kinase
VPQLDDPPSDAELTRRLLDFLGLSLLIGLAGGVLIGRLITAPISDLARAAQRVGQGELQVRVPVRGSQELVDLASSFNRMAADLQMADVSHELRTPLSALEGNLRAALDHVTTLDESEIAHLYEQTRHLIRLVNDLRELGLAESRQLPLEKRPTDLGALVIETLQALEPLADDQGIRLIDRIDRQPEVLVDPSRIRQVLFNLLTNALRHTPPGGAITVSVCGGDKSRSRETGGTGLGLAIVKAICEAHGGRVEVASAGNGRGSTFSVTLPIEAHGSV